MTLGRKNLKSEVQKHRQAPSDLSLPRKLGKKRKRNSAEGTENIEKAPLRLQTVRSSLTKRRKRSIAWTGHHMTLVRLSAITVRKWVTMPIDV